MVTAAVALDPDAHRRANRPQHERALGFEHLVDGRGSAGQRRQRPDERLAAAAHERGRGEFDVLSGQLAGRDRAPWSDSAMSAR